MKKYDTHLERQETPPLPEEPIARDLMRLTFLAQMSEDLLQLVRASKTQIKGSRELEDIVQKASEFIPRQAVASIADYVKTPFIDDSKYERLKASPEGDAPPLERLAESYARIDLAAYNLVHASLQSGRNFTENKLHGIARKHFEDMNKWLTKHRIDPSIRRDSIKAAVMSAAEQIRANYELHRDEMKDAILEFEENTTLLVESTDTDNLFAQLKGWNIGAAYSELQYSLGKAEKGATPGEYKQYRQQVENARANLAHVLPAIRTTAFSALHKRLQQIQQSLDTVLTYDTGAVVTHDAQLLEMLLEVKAIKDRLADPSIGEIIGEKAEAVPSTITGLYDKIDDELMKFFKTNKEVFRYLATTVVQQKNLLLNTDTFDEAANKYNEVFGQHSWQNRTSFSGAYTIAKRIEDDFLGMLRSQLSAIAEEQQNFRAEEVRAESSSEALLEKTQLARKLVAKIAKEKGSKPLYAALTRMREFDELTVALEEPTATLAMRDKLRDIARLAFGDVGMHEFPRMYQSYLEGMTKIDAEVAQIEPDAPFRYALISVGEQARKELQVRLFTKAQLIARQYKEDPKPLTDKMLDERAEALEQIMRLHKNIFPDSTISVQLQEALSVYMNERVRREEPSYKLKKWWREHFSFGPQKYYVLDTNVIMNDSTSIFGFGAENAVVITNEVLSELEKNKTGKGDAPVKAREAMRVLTPAIENNPGKKLMEGVYMHKIRMEEREYTIITYDQDADLRHKAMRRGPGSLTDFFYLMREQAKNNTNPDSQIIMSAERFAHALGPRVVNPLRMDPRIIFVSKDQAARVHAHMQGVEAQDHLRDRLSQDPDKMYSGYRLVQLPESLWTDIQRSKLTPGLLSNIADASLDPSNILNAQDMRDTTFIENEFVIAGRFPPGSERPQDEQNVIVLRHRAGFLEPLRTVEDKFPLLYLAEHPEIQPLYTLQPKNAPQLVMMELVLDPSIEIMTMVGAAGTGKTTLAAAAGLAYVKSSGTPYQKMYYTKPNVEIEAVGFLPGTLEKKLAPAFMPFGKAVYKLTNPPEAPEPEEAQITKHLREQHGNIIELHAFNFMRGADVNGIRILDEAQNTNTNWMKLFVTRHSDPSKTIICGDPYQIDDPALENSNGLAHLRLGFLGQDNYGHITLGGKPVRSRVALQGQELIPYKGKR